MIKWFTSHRWLALLMGIVLLAWSYCPEAERFEQGVYSLLTNLVLPANVAVKTVVVTVGNDSSSSDPVSYVELAKVLDYLGSAGSRAIGITVPLDHSQTVLDHDSIQAIKGALESARRKKQDDLPNAEEIGAQLDPDALLIRSLKSSDRLVLGVSNAMAGGLTPLAVEAPSNEQSLVFPALAVPAFHYSPGPVTLAKFSENTTSAIQVGDHAGIMAATPLAMPFGEHYLPTFELMLASRALKVSPGAVTIHPGKGVMLGTAWYPTDAGLRVYPQMSASTIQVFSGQDVLAGKLDRKLRGKTVLLGLKSDRAVMLPGGQKVSPLQAMAHSVNALLNESFVKVPSWSMVVQRGALLLVLLYLLVIPVRLRGLLGLSGGIVLAILMLNGSLLLLILKNTWLPSALPVFFLVSGQVMVWVHHRFAHSFSRMRTERDHALVELAEQLSAQGKLDKAFERLKGCAKSDRVMDALYQLGLNFERRRQFSKALMTYEHIAQWKPHYRDITERRARHHQAHESGSLAATMVSHAATTLVVDDPVVERPVLGRYEIERELGRGAMGTVYLGRDPRIGRTVAIKTLPLTEEFESTQLDEVRRRFFQEAETAGRLSHPSIVTIYDVGEEHDLAYIAMDYIQGDSLDQHIRKKELLPLVDVFTVGIEVAEALAYAHKQNVVHRDVKPGNIIYDREKYQLKVTDFGIACLTDNSKTRTGTVLGSPYYMSPEQIAGQKVDGRSDLFSLGVTLYQLFTGKLPFEGDSLTNLMYQITHNKPVSVRKVRSDLPSCLTRIINKSMEKKPSNRYEDGMAMAEALKRCANQSGVGYHAG